MWPGEGAGHQHDPGPAKLARLLDDALLPANLDVVSSPADVGVQLVEQGDQAMVGELPGVVGNIGVEQPLDPRPVRREQRVPARQ